MKRTLVFMMFLACAAPLTAQSHEAKSAHPKATAADKKAAHATSTDVKDSRRTAANESKTKSKHAKSNESGESKHGSATHRKRRSHHAAADDGDVLPDIEHERVDYWVAAFSKMHDYHRKIAEGFVRKAKYQTLLERKLRQRGMPQNLIYLAFEESAFNPDAGSRAHAVGIWQLTPATARLYGLKVNKKVDERKNVDKETDAALRFLSHLHKRFGCWYLAAAAYNSGENRMARIMRKRFGHERGRDRDYYKVWDAIPGETRDYVPSIIALKRIGRDPARYGF